MTRGVRLFVESHAVVWVDTLIGVGPDEIAVDICYTRK